MNAERVGRASGLALRLGVTGGASARTRGAHPCAPRPSARGDGQSSALPAALVSNVRRLLPLCSRRCHLWPSQQSAEVAPTPPTVQVQGPLEERRVTCLRSHLIGGTAQSPNQVKLDARTRALVATSLCRGPGGRAHGLQSLGGKDTLAFGLQNHADRGARRHHGACAIFSGTPSGTQSTPSRPQEGCCAPTRKGSGRPPAGPPLAGRQEGHAAPTASGRTGGLGFPLSPALIPPQR